ncbi:hypothetical protein G9A89_015383 [Geosiphon pyriformis]|nr:hypothetical protein G9A89_015383 [Geosiphon pyriformis]
MTQQSWKLAIVVYQLIPSSLQQPSGLRQWNSGAGQPQNYLSFLVTSEDALTNKLTFAQKQLLTSNILPATITEDKFLATIFPFKFEETTTMPLFSGATFEAKPVTAMYTDAKVEGQSIKLILDSGRRVDRAVSARIIIADRATKTPISKIDDFSFEVNGIVTPIKVLVMEATQYQALVGTPANILGLTHMCTGHRNLPEKLTKSSGPMPTTMNYHQYSQELIWKTDNLTWTDNKQEEPSSWEEKENTQANNTYIPYTYSQQQLSTYCRPKLICVDCGKKLSSMGACCGNDEEYQMATKFYCHACHVKHFGRLKRVGKWDNTPYIAYRETLLNEGIRGTCDMSCQYTILISNWVEKETPIEATWRRAPVINFLKPEEFHEHYQNLAPTREEQEQWLAQRKTNQQLCIGIRITNKCNPDSDNNDKNTSSSSVQNGNDNKDDSNSDSNSELNYEQYITLPDLSKEQELKWYSDNGEGIMPECVHNTDAEFDLRYPGKETIKLEPHSHICIDLKVALEIPATTMVQLASRSSLAKRKINIRGGIIDAEYVGNIIAMLQNDSEKAYIIEPNEKIAQTIFLPLVKVAQLVSVGKKEKLGITVRGIQGFRSMDRIDVLVNMAEKEIVGQGEIISTSQAIFIPPYSQYMLAIERKKKEQEQIFEAVTNLCKSREIGLINLHIPAKSYSCIKISIYNNTGNVINVPEGTIIGYLNTKIEDQPPNSIPDFLQLCGYVNITSQTIYG